MSASSEISPGVRPASALAEAIDALSDGVGLVENGRLLLANRALSLALAQPTAETAESDPDARVGALVRWAERGTSERAHERLRIGPNLAELSALALDVPGYASRAVFASLLNDENAPSDALERFIEFGSSLANVSADIPKAALIRDLVAFTSEREEGYPIDVTRVIEAVTEAARKRMEARAHFVARFGRVPRVRAQESRLAHALWHVLTNAVEAFSAKPQSEPRIVIATRSEGSHVVVEVSDTGGGIAEGDLLRVTEPFFTNKPQHAGLGLAVCRHVVSSFGGELGVQSLLGEGTAVRIALPAAERRPSTLPPPEGGGARILIIDDEPLLGQTLKYAFSSRHDVAVVTSGRDALNLFAADARYDLVLCDLMMPDMPGQQVFEAVERDHPQLLPRFFFMTGGAFTDSAQEFIDRHPDRRIDKPFTIADIERLLEKLS